MPSVCTVSLSLAPWTVFFSLPNAKFVRGRFFRIVIFCGLNELNYDYGQGNPFFVGECGLCLDTKNNSFPGHTLVHKYAATIHGQTYYASLTRPHKCSQGAQSDKKWVLAY